MLSQIPEGKSCTHHIKQRTTRVEFYLAMQQRASSQPGWADKSSGWQRVWSTSSNLQNVSGTQLETALFFSWTRQSLMMNEPDSGDLIYIFSHVERGSIVVMHNVPSVEIIMLQWWQDRALSSKRCLSCPYMFRLCVTLLQDLSSCCYLTFTLHWSSNPNCLKHDHIYYITTSLHIYLHTFGLGCFSWFWTIYSNQGQC